MAASYRSFVSYIDKSRRFYAAQGYDVPYTWATHSDAPFTPLAKPLSQCRVGVITTSSLAADAPREPYAAPSIPTPAAMVTQHLSWHKAATHTDDLGSFLPLDHLAELKDAGVIGSVAPRFVGVPTVYSQRRTQKWAESVLNNVVEDEVDLALLLPI